MTTQKLLGVMSRLSCRNFEGSLPKWSFNNLLPAVARVLNAPLFSPSTANYVMKIHSTLCAIVIVLVQYIA